MCVCVCVSVCVYIDRETEAERAQTKQVEKKCIFTFTAKPKAFML